MRDVGPRALHGARVTEPAADLPVLLAILDLADKRLRQSRKEAEHG